MIRNEKYKYTCKKTGKTLNIVIECYGSGGISNKYYLNDKLHREDGPAYVWYDESGEVEYEYYYLNNKFHREDGPAIIYYYKSGGVHSEEYFLNGKKVNKEDLPNQNKGIKEDSTILELLLQCDENKLEKLIKVLELINTI